ncbi:MAG: cysteine desulfurase family protein [Melioribacteraceae bacterium]
MIQIYFDNAATTKLHPKVLEKMLPFLKEDYGNASAIHSFGRKARVAIEESRETIANFINADPSEIYFTSGGTESNNFIINGVAKTEFLESGKRKIVTSKVEHHSILHTFEKLETEGFFTKYINVDEKFLPIMNQFQNEIDSDTSMISQIHVNNETGSIFDFSELETQNIYIHTDAVQSFGKIIVDVEKLGIHALSASAHKINGPKGIGIAYVKSGTPIESFILGGGQERNRRAGTENVAGIVGFAEAVKISKDEMQNNFEKVSSIKNYFIENLESHFKEKILINSFDNFSPYILSITFNPEFYKNDSETILMNLDINHIAASSGSACASGTLKLSHVILASGKSKEYANGTLRFSFSPENKIEEVDYTISILKKIADKNLK